MGPAMFLGVFFIVPTVVLVTLSFFVLFVNRKSSEQGLKAFGYAVAILLWLSAAALLVLLAYTVSMGRHHLPMMPQMMKDPMGCSSMQGHMGPGQAR